MEYVGILLVFAGVHFLAAASPGPNLILVSSHAIRYSSKGALMLSLGVVTGTFLWASSAALGLGVLIAKFPNVYFVIQHIGALYLIWLGVKMLRDGWRNSYQPMGNVETSQQSHKSLFAAGFFVNMTNPKSVVYWGSLFSVMLPVTSPGWVFAVAIFLAVSISSLWWISVSVFFSDVRIQTAFASLRRYMDGLMGGALVLLGGKIIYDR